MNIDVNKVLANKNNKKPIQQKFEALRESYSPVNSIKYMEFVRKQSLSSILENSQYLYSLPTSGTDFLMTVIKSNDLKLEDLQVQRENISNFLNKCRENRYANTEHIQQLIECVQYLDTEISRKSTTEALMEDLKYQLILDFLPKPTLEVTNKVADEMDIIIQNINYQPEVMAQYEKLVKKIKNWKAAEVVVNFVPLLVKNTALVLGLTIMTAGITVSMMLSLPMLLAAQTIKTKVDKKYVDSYIRIIEKEMKRISQAISTTTDEKQKTMLQQYSKNLSQAKKSLMEYKATRGQKNVKKLVKKTTKIVREGITEMAPSIPIYQVESTDTENNIDEIADELVEQLIVSESDIEEYFDDDIDDYDEFDDIDEYECEEDEESLEHEFTLEFIDVFGTDGEEVNLENFNNLILIANKYAIIKEGSRKSLSRKIALKAEDASKKIAHTARQAGNSAKHTAVVAKRVPQHIDNLVNNTLDTIKKMDSNERRKRIIEGGFKLKLYKIIRNGIALGVAYAVSPTIAAIGLITGVAIDKKLDQKERFKILHELENELKIVEEKIEDAKGDSNREKKYQLMRIKNKLEDDIARIKYRLDK